VTIRAPGASLGAGVRRDGASLAPGRRRRTPIDTIWAPGAPDRRPGRSTIRA